MKLSRELAEIFEPVLEEIERPSQCCVVVISRENGNVVAVERFLHFIKYPVFCTKKYRFLLKPLL